MLEEGDALSSHPLEDLLCDSGLSGARTTCNADDQRACVRHASIIRGL